MTEQYALLAELMNKLHTSSVAALLQRLANMPGFHGVRAQVWDLFQEARLRGYFAELPHLFFMQKVSHGDRMLL